MMAKKLTAADTAKSADKFATELERKRVTKLGRGSVRMQRSLFYTRSEWEEQKKAFPSKLAYLRRKLKAQ